MVAVAISFLLVFTILLMVIIVAETFMKPAYRKYRYLIIKKSLDEENRKLITEKEDLEFLEEQLVKFGWYAKRWYLNLTPNYQSRWRKFKKIVEKYNLDVEIFDYTEEEK